MCEAMGVWGCQYQLGLCVCMCVCMCLLEGRTKKSCMDAIHFIYRAYYGRH